MLPIVAGLSACLTYISVGSLYGKNVDYKHIITVFFLSVVLYIAISAFC